VGARLDVVKPCPGVGGGSGRAGASCGPYARGAGRRGGAAKPRLEESSARSGGESRWWTYWRDRGAGTQAE
jgi:hypothetical protein